MGHRYPYLAQDRLLALRLDNDFDLSTGATPPSGAAGGADQFKLWMDTSIVQPVLRIATVARATPGAYVAAEWADVFRIDLPSRQLNFGAFNSDSVNTGVINANGTIRSTVGIEADQGFITFDRSGSGANWSMYSNGGIFRIFNSVTGDKFTINPNGNIFGDVFNSTRLNVSDSGNVSGALSVGSIHAFGPSTFDSTLGVSGALNVGSIHAFAASTFDGLLTAGGVNTGVLNCTSLNCTSGGGISAGSGPVSTNFGLVFYARDNPSFRWELYANAGDARLYNNISTTDVLRIDQAGSMQIGGSLFCVDVNATGAGVISGNLQVSGNVSVSGSVLVNGYTQCSYVTGGPSGAGALNTFGTGHHVCFRWDGDWLYYRVDETVERAIATAGALTALAVEVQQLNDEITDLKKRLN